MLSLLFLLACPGASTTDPCEDYCNYVCDCHAGEADYDCDSCFTTYADADAELQDQCSTSLLDLKAEDEAAGKTCEGDNGSDTGI